MFGIGGTELVLIMLFVLIIFGPDKLPELARTVGRAIKMFKDAQEDMQRLISAEAFAEDRRTADRLAGAKAATTGTPAPEVAKPAPAPVSAASEIWSDEDEEEGEEE